MKIIPVISVRFRRVDWRGLKHWWQRVTRGWSDDVTWNLNDCLAEYTLPRLKRFREIASGHPMGLTEESWEEIIDKMIYAFEGHIKDPGIDDFENIEAFRKHHRKVQEGFCLFGKYYQNLWW